MEPRKMKGMKIHGGVSPGGTQGGGPNGNKGMSNSASQVEATRRILANEAAKLSSRLDKDVENADREKRMPTPNEIRRRKKVMKF